jgi:hypothetical protein
MRAVLTAIVCRSGSSALAALSNSAARRCDARARHIWRTRLSDNSRGLIAVLTLKVSKPLTLRNATIKVCPNLFGTFYIEKDVVPYA